ncbi:ABC transporter ATP-binding protein [Mycoplasmopsis primatum]|uniref:ABC transporter ATP-binding protein n=1 Tax=Mycoplasmopsis primatum TaxID=55604 RepID=UPI0004971939|nr:ABC transporter ATP-binding protein [Mycoplasmopsis primatum]
MKTNQQNPLSSFIDNFANSLTQHEQKIKEFARIKPKEYENLHKIVEIKNLVKEFRTGKNKLKAVNDLTLSIYENQNIALLGSNGAGKTTAVEMLVGIQKPTSGLIKYLIDDANSEKENNNHSVGIQFQDSSYPQGLTVKDIIKSINLLFGNKMDANSIKQLIKIFGINEFLNSKASALSGGQHQRLNALLAIIHKPKIIILDELSTGLDIKIKSRLIKFIKQFAKLNNSTLIIVSHDINEIEELADRIVILNHGYIVYDEKINDVVKEFGTVNKCLQHFI